MRKIPVTKPYFTQEERDLVSHTLDSGWVAQGQMVKDFEKMVAEHEGIREGIATTSCTTALHLAMVAQGLSAGMDVLAPAFTFVATENAIIATGANPVMVDIKQDTFNIDVDELQNTIDMYYKNKDGKLVNKTTGNILWGMIPVHEFGLCCEINKINGIAKEYKLQVIEDSACALGAKIGEKNQGDFGNTSCVSFHPRKSITTGEGGMILTNNIEFAKRMRELRTHGGTVSADERDKGRGFLLPEFNETGFNYRMTDIQGAVGQAQIKKLDFIIEEKRKHAKLYNEIIQELLPEFITPIEPVGYFHTYQSYVCMLDYQKLNLNTIEEGGNYRNNMLQKLENIGIATRQGTHAVHMLGYYRKRYGYKWEDFPNAYSCDRLSITLPLYVGMTDEDQVYIVEMIRKVIDET